MTVCRNSAALSIRSYQVRSNVIRLLSVLLGALPATWLASFAVLVVLVALDNNDPIPRTVGMLWGVSGVLGAIGAWLIIFDVGSRTTVTRRLVISLVTAGIAAASVPLIGAFQQLFSSSSADRIFMVCVVAAIGSEPARLPVIDTRFHI
jgi:hypothetical protein